MTRIASPPVAAPWPTWRESIMALKRELIDGALRQSDGNRTRAAESLGLQRTYLLRLIREMGVSTPAPMRRDLHRGTINVAARGTVQRRIRTPGPRTRSHAEPC